MDKIGYIEIRIQGSKGNLDLSPENYDIREIISILENAENLLYPDDKRDRPTISYKIEEGSVRHILKTSIQYYRTEAFWADAEFYFYGKVTNAGGKDKANIHIFTEELGTVRIQTPISFLEQYDENLLYKTFGIRAVGKQHSETGEIDVSTLRFIELVDYQPKYDELYLKALAIKQKNHGLVASILIIGKRNSRYYDA
jgi:hypothetical protein